MKCLKIAFLISCIFTALVILLSVRYRIKIINEAKLILESREIIETLISKFISKVKINCSTGIVKIIHHSWKTKNIPSVMTQTFASWKDRCFKEGWEFKFWSDKDNLELITTHYPWFYNIYINMDRHIKRVDVIRYFYMFHYGGIYTDLDNECLNNFVHLLKCYSMVFGAMEGSYLNVSLKEGYVQNSFMYSVPRHPFWLKLILAIINNETINLQPEIATGPIILINTLKEYLNDDRNGNESKSIKIYEPFRFNPISWVTRNPKLCFYASRKICADVLRANGSFIAQYHFHSWG